MQKVAVIGLGNIATRHRRNLKTLFPNATLYAMSASGRQPQEEVNDCDAIVASIDELIEKQLDMVIIASPATCHAQHAIPFIQSGVATFIEKPVVASAADVETLIQTTEKYPDTPVAVGYCLRYLPSTNVVKNLLSKNGLGTLYNAFVSVGQYLPDWRPTKDFRNSVSANASLGGGALLELSHDLDYSRWLLGPLSLQHAILRSSQELALDVEDMADISLLTEQGAVAHVHLDFLQRKASRQCSFIGSKGRLDWDLVGNEVLLCTAKGTEVLYSEPEWDKNQMYLLMLEDFVNSIKGESNQCITVTEAAETIYLIDDIKQKSEIVSD